VGTAARCARLAVLGAALVLTGCRGWRNHGDTFYGAVAGKRAKQETTYTFGSPGDAWRPARDFPGVQVAWVNTELSAIITIHAQCEEQGDSSLDQYTDHLRIDWTDWVVVSQEKLTLIGRDALRTVVNGRLDGIPRTNELVVVKKNGCLFDLIYSASPAYFDAGRADFAQVVAGFQFPMEGA
jgi:hypothetical protein